MNIRQRCKRKARTRQVDTFVLDFDDGSKLQVPIFVDRINELGPGDAIASAVRGALLVDAASKGVSGITDVEVTVEGRDIQIDWIGEV